MNYNGVIVVVGGSDSVISEAVWAAIDPKAGPIPYMIRIERLEGDDESVRRQAHTIGRAWLYTYNGGE